MPRVAPITGKSDVPAEFHPVVDDVLSVFGQVRGPFSMLLHSPPLAERMLQFVKFNRGGTVVEPRLLSHAILASVRERDAHYVWSAQVGAARRAGVPEATIDMLRAKGDPGSLGEDERDIVNDRMKFGRHITLAGNRRYTRHVSLLPSAYRPA